jgi:hypothetical protein
MYPCILRCWDKEQIKVVINEKKFISLRVLCDVVLLTRLRTLSSEVNMFVQRGIDPQNEATYCNSDLTQLCYKWEGVKNFCCFLSFKKHNAFMKCHSILSLTEQTKSIVQGFVLKLSTSFSSLLFSSHLFSLLLHALRYHILSFSNSNVIWFFVSCPIIWSF